MWMIREKLGHRKNFTKQQIFIFQFLLKMGIGIWNSFFDLIMRTKNYKKLKFYIILQQKSNVPFDPRIFEKYTIFRF